MWVQQASLDKKAAFQNLGDADSGDEEDLEPLMALQCLGEDLGFLFGVRWKATEGVCHLEDGKSSGKMTKNNMI